MMVRRIADEVSRFFVGGLFIFSGLIKLNDPVGTKIKMEEYFYVFSEDFGAFFKWFIPVSLEIGMILIVLEIVIGIAILINYKMNITTKILLALMVFFTFLTFYSWYFNKVTDCGCFGDAIKLTPGQSFVKDLILMPFALHLFWYRKRYIPVFYSKEGFSIILGATLLCLFLGIYAVRHLPFIDFRAYRIGNYIPQQMQPEEQPIIEYTFEKNGERVKSQKFLEEKDGYKYIGSDVLNRSKTVAKITDFAVNDPNGEDITSSMFEGAKLIFIVYDVDKISLNNISDIRKLTTDLDGKVEMMALTASSSDQFEKFRHENQLAIPYNFTDATVLKTIVRANPGITLWVDGTVRGMWHHNDTPEAQEVLDLIKK